MNPVLKLVPGEPPTAPIDTAATTSAHLVRCARCGELNGRSADACWHCEAELEWRAPLAGLVAVPPPPAVVHEAWHDLGEPPAVTAGHPASAANGPAGLQLDLPVLSSAVDPADWVGAQAAAPRAAALPGRAAAPWGVLGMLVGAGALVVGGVYLAFDVSGSDVPRRTAAALSMQREPVAAVRVPLPELAPVDAALRSAEQVLGARPAPEPDAPTAPTATPEPTPVPAGGARVAPAKSVAATTRPRAATRASVAPATPPVPTVAVTRPARSGPAPSIACTPNVVALGLCAAPSTTSKE